MSKEKSAPSLKRKLQNAGLHIEEVDGVKTLYDGEGDPICQDDLQDQIEAIEDEIGEVGESGTIRDDISRCAKLSALNEFTNFQAYNQRVYFKVTTAEPGYRRQTTTSISTAGTIVLWDVTGRDGSTEKVIGRMQIIIDADLKKHLQYQILNADGTTYTTVNLADST